jgi:hypothetical protein
VRARSFALPAIALGVATVLLAPSYGQGFVLLGFQLGLDFRSVRVCNNFTDASANDNTLADPSWPGAKGAPLAIWKACSEWNSELHNLTGNGDPSQPGDIGSGGANFDISWQGKSPVVGGPTDMTHSEISGTNGGVFAYTEGPGGGAPNATGWRIRYYQNWTWEDGPSTSIVGGAYDLQGIATHEYGHALGLGHSMLNTSTMYAVVLGNGSSWRTIEADDIAGLQAIYGVKDTNNKPKITSISGPGPAITITGVNFAATDNEVWFTQAEPATSRTPVKVTNLTSNGTTIVVNVPAGVGPGDIQVKKGGVSTADGLSNAFGITPLLPGQCLVVNYCTPGISSSFCMPSMTWTGNPSASSGSGFTLRCENLNGQRTALIFYGVTGRLANPWSAQSSSFMCVKSPHQRTPAANSGGTNGNCDGTIAIDWNAFIASNSNVLGSPFSAGDIVDAQCWYRDPSAPKTTNLSDGLEFTVCP